jgi:hypothetical protein
MNICDYEKFLGTDSALEMEKEYRNKANPAIFILIFLYILALE